MSDLTITEERLVGLLKQSAAEMRVVAKEKEILLKFATAVEILPALEKAAVVKFPDGLSFSEKALRLTKKSSAELEKLAYMADHLPETITEVAKVAESQSQGGDRTMGRLTEFVLSQA